MTTLTLTFDIYQYEDSEGQPYFEAWLNTDNHSGLGPTPFDAIADLMQQKAEHYESNPEPIQAI